MKRLTLIIALLLVSLLASCGEPAVVAVRADGNLSVAVRDDGSVYTWGGQVYEMIAEPTLFTLVDNVTDLAAGNNFVLWKTSGGVFGTGRRDLLPIGDESTDKAALPIKLLPSGSSERGTAKYDTAFTAIDLADAAQLAAGDDFTLALKADGTVYAWGLNNYEQLGGAAEGTASNVPVKIERLSAIRRVAASGNLAAALDMNGNVWTWGGTAYDAYGSRIMPEVVDGLPHIVEIYASDSGYAALDKEGDVWVWAASGMSADSKLYSESPERVPIQATITAAAVCGDGTIMALDDAKQLWYCPADGIGSRIILTDVSAVSAGNTHVIALKSDGNVYTHGGNNNGQIGNGTREEATEPYNVRIK